MKILHINKSDRVGGAAVAAVRLLDALRKNGSDARMLVLSAKEEREDVEPVVKTRFGRAYRYLRFLGEVLSFIPFEKNRKNRFSFSRGFFGFDISRHPLVQEADVLHLHWINQGFLSLGDIKKLIQTGKPIVWTLHDTWAFTGGCHYPDTCGGFTSTCGQCPLLKSPGINDLSARQLAKKERIFENAAVSFVGCSKWMQEMAAKSSLVRKDLKHSVNQVFNPIDTDLFQPGNQGAIRTELGLPGDKKLLLFGAANVTDPRKGTDLLLRALKELFSSEPSLAADLELVAFGKNIDLLSEKTPFKLHSFDVVAGEKAMAKLYQACDMFVLPSMQDNLPNTVVESMSCGTPVVAFNIGGVPEMITHQHSGFLASPGNVKDFAQGIRFVMEHNSQLGENARNFAEVHFAPETIARQYQEIYRSVLKEKKRMQLPKISIITVVFNGADTILPTIRSISALTYTNLEFIVIDGASNDGTVDIIKENESLITRWISEPDSGLYDAMNKGMDLATGDYFWFINAGDEPASSDVLNDVLQGQNPADVYFGQTMLINPDGSEIGLRRLSPPEELNWRHFRQGMLVSHQAFIASRKVAKRYDLRYKFSADFEWCLHALKKASEVRNTGKVMCRFREGGLTKQNILPGLKERFRIMVKYYGLSSTVFAHFTIAPKFLYYWIRNKRF